MRILLIVLVLLIVFETGLFSQNAPDVLKMILDSVGFDRDDLGYTPRGYWSRFPLDVPYKLTSFDDLFAEPLKLYDYGKTMANAADIYLSPAYLDSNSDALYKLTYALGVDRKLGGFRSHSANLLEVKDSINALEHIIEYLYDYAKSGTSLMVSNSEINNIERFREYLDKTNNALNNINQKVQLILAKLILNIGDVIKWRDRAFRSCNPKDIIADTLLVKMLGDMLNMGMYYPQIDDVAENIDWWALHYAGLKAVAIAEETADSLIHYGGIDKRKHFVIPTPFGQIILLGEEFFITDSRPIDFSDALLVVDFGNSGTFTGTCGSGNVSFFIDLGGDDTYRAPALAGPVDSIPKMIPSQGMGIYGIGVLYDANGNDTYIGGNMAQGSGFFGVGILYDKEGDDIYSAELMAQGAGYFGIGMLIDVAGNDSFYVYGYGQGFGGHGGGIGVLVDYDGNDKYVAEPSPEIYDLADYHSELKINGNFAQGVGYGRRADLTDGHSYAGGVGAIIDISGNDHYLSGNWSLGTAYWFATGIAFDGSGDDIYESCYFTQGSGAHFCNGILIDEGGNDKHELYETAGAGLGFGWDFVNAFLINMGGDDSYRANMISIGCAEVRSNAFLIDIGGNDLYRVKKGALSLGAVDFRPYYDKPAKLHTYFTDAKSFGGFIDIGGHDAYISYTDSTEVEHPIAGNNKCWFKPEKADSAYGSNNFGVGIDIEEGVISEIERWK